MGRIAGFLPICAVLLAVAGASLGLAPELLMPGGGGLLPLAGRVRESESGMASTLPHNTVFPDEDARRLPLQAAGTRLDGFGSGPRPVPWVAPDGAVAASPRLPALLVTGDLFGVLRGKRGGERWRRDREVRVYDRKTRRWYRYYIPSISMNNVFGQFRPMKKVLLPRRRVRSATAAFYPVFPATRDGPDYGSDTENQGGEDGAAPWMSALAKRAMGRDIETGPFDEDGYY